MAEPTILREPHQHVRYLDNPVTVGPPAQVESTRRQNVGPTERMVSMTLGGMIVGYGLGRGDLTGLAIAAAATGLICRGVTGHCAVYQAAGINTAR